MPIFYKTNKEKQCYKQVNLNMNEKTDFFASRIIYFSILTFAQDTENMENKFL